MAETQLIAIQDVKNYRKIDSKFDTERFNSFVNEVQRINLRELLGDGLYYDFMNDARTAGKYFDLLNGATYHSEGITKMFYGVKPVLCYWWLSLAAREGDLFMSNVGAIQFVNNPQQSFESVKEKERISASYMRIAQMYANDLVNFLNAKNTTYPLWVSEKTTNPSNFISFRL